MPTKILIVDNDTGFNDLLTDIFTQASYQVFSENNAIEALNLFKKGPFDLVITDQNMPEMTGIELIKELQSINPGVCVIVASEFLEEKVIQELSKLGVYNVFKKPINIFSLTKKTLELLKTTQENKSKPATSKAKQETSAKIQSYPCISEASKEFSKRLITAKDFSSLLLLEGKFGSPYLSICKDFENISKSSNTEKFIYPNKAIVDEADLIKRIHCKTDTSITHINFIITDLNLLPDPQIINQIEKNTQSFKELKTEIRFIVCLNTTHSENFLKQINLQKTTHIQVPSLNDCPEDIGQLSQNILNNISQLTGLKTQQHAIPNNCLDYLKSLNWIHNYKQLKGVILTALSFTENNESLSLPHFKEAYKSYIIKEILSPENENLNKKLDIFKNDYIKASYELLLNDRERTLKALNINDVMLTSALESETFK